MGERRGMPTYCPHCEADREVIKTVPWQDDHCAECGNPIPAETTE